MVGRIGFLGFLITVSNLKNYLVPIYLLLTKIFVQLMVPDPSDFPTNVNGVHAVILRRLWSMQRVSSDELRTLTGQSEWARRTRELRGEFGYPIVKERMGGVNYYRLTGHIPLFPRRRRPYFSRRQKEVILSDCGPRCAICGMDAEGSSVDEVSTSLMWDHRVPFDHGGETDADNGQPLCRNCNNLKKQACSTCWSDDGCTDCLYAYPERAENIVIVELDDEAIDRLLEYAQEKDVSIQEAARRLLKNQLSTSDGSG